MLPSQILTSLLALSRLTFFIEVVPLDLNDANDICPEPYPISGPDKYVREMTEILDYEYTLVQPKDIARAALYNVTQGITEENFVLSAKDLSERFLWAKHTKFVFLGISEDIVEPKELGDSSLEEHITVLWPRSRAVDLRVIAEMYGTRFRTL
jgi:hypothetical protein